MTRRSFGNVTRLPSGQWRAKFVGPDGRRRGAPGTFKTKGDATRWLAQTETDISRGTWLDPFATAVTLRSYSDGWLSQRTVKGRPLAPRTVQTYRHSLEAWILPALGEVRLVDLTPFLIRTWHAEVSQKTGPTALRQAYATLRAILNTAVSDVSIRAQPLQDHRRWPVVQP